MLTFTVLKFLTRYILCFKYKCARLLFIRKEKKQAGKRSGNKTSEMYESAVKADFFHSFLNSY